MKKPVKRVWPVVSARIVFLFAFSLFYWGFHFVFKKTNLQLSQVVFNLAAGLFSGAVAHVGMAKVIGPLLFGRGFCGWACWNAAVFDIVPLPGRRKTLPEKALMYKYAFLALALFVPLFLIAGGHSFLAPEAQFRWLLLENAAIYALGLAMAFVLGDRRAFCKYICPAGALMTVTSPLSVLKVEKNHLRCNKCRRCEEVCPMDVPVLSYISANQRVSHPECILCMECVRHCPKNCLTVGVGRKTNTTPGLSRSF